MKRLLVLLSFLGAMVFLPAQPVTFAQVDVLAPSCQGVTPTPPSCKEKNDNLLGTNSLLAGVVRLFSIVVGVIAVIMIVIAGLRFVTSSGDPAGVESARNTLLYAVVGIVIAAFAQIIVIFVLDKL